MTTATPEAPAAPAKAKSTPEDDANDARYAALRKQHFAWEGEDPSVMSADYALHVATAYGFAAVATIHLKRTANDDVVLSSTYYTDPDQEAQFEAMMKGKKRTKATASAVLAKVLGWREQDVSDLRFLASLRDSKAAQQTVAWTTYFLRHLADVDVPDVKAEPAKEETKDATAA